MSTEHAPRVLTPDQRLRVFISSTLAELALERAAARRAIEGLQLTPVFFEHGARPHPPQALYRAYLEQSQVFVGIYWQSYGWIAPSDEISGLEDEFRLSSGLPRLLYVKKPAPEREARLQELLASFAEDPSCTYKSFSSPDELAQLLAADLALLLSERFQAGAETTGVPPGGIPTPATSFVGRAPELERIEELLTQDGTRLVTLTGPGGIGKTRLAIEAARRNAHGFRQGSVFVPLDGIEGSELVLPTVAAELGVRETGGDPLDALVAHLHPRSLLLVLDNFEHVIDAAPALGVLLERAPELKVLVTSRERLKLRGEHELAVPPLPPDEEAIDLFRERAAASHVFRLGPDDLRVVAEICRRLDGVPLAIELAAPGLRLLSPEQLLDRLRERLVLAGPRDAPARQQTLDAAINWSYDLLSADEQRLFDQLGIFRGSFTLDAVAEVSELPAGSDFTELLASLLDKSIVYRVFHEGQPRFAMLSMIRDFARGRLELSGQLEAAFARLAYFYVGLAPEAEAGLPSIGQRHWKRLLDAEIDNIRPVLAWLDERRRGEEMAILMRGLWMWFWLRGQLTESREWLRLALEHEPIPPGDRGWLVASDAMFAMFQGNFDVAYEGLSQARSLFAEARDERGEATVQMCGAILVAMLEEEAEGQRRAAESLATFERLGDAWGIAMSLNVMAWLRTMFARHEGAGDLFQRALAASQRVGDEMAIAMSLLNLAEAKLAAGEVGEARRTATRGLKLLHAGSSNFAVPDLLDTLGVCCVTEGRYEQAAELFGAASALRETMRVPLWGAPLIRREELLATLRTELGDDRFAAAEELGRTRPVEFFLPAELEVDAASG